CFDQQIFFEHVLSLSALHYLRHLRRGESWNPIPNAALVPRTSSSRKITMSRVVSIASVAVLAASIRCAVSTLPGVKRNVRAVFRGVSTLLRRNDFCTVTPSHYCM